VAVTNHNFADRMRAAATAFLGALDDRQRRLARAAFDIPEHREWTYLPGSRPGIPLADLTPDQRALAMALLDTGASERGAADTRSVLWGEAVGDDLPQTRPGSDADVYEGQRYWVRILGDPDEAVWAWRLNGHHVAFHLTVVGDQVTGTPQFLGSNPATFLDGPYQGLRPMPAEEDLARDLLAALEPGQREAAVVSPQAPRDILTRFDPVADPGVIDTGLGYADLGTEQRQLLTLLIGQYVGRVTEQVALRAWQDITDAGLERVSFAWAGGTQRGDKHYYAVAGPTFLIEYDNTQDDANHIHSVWRDLRHDWGGDLLARHYAMFGH
jgi:Protein of unknown function (DUF3500)